MEHPSEPASTGRLHGAAAVRLHLTALVGIALCLAAGAFELTRAIGGNELSWAYVFEWPIFAVFAVYMWWKLYNGESIRRAPSGSSPKDQEADEKLEAWNKYLAELHASDPDAKRSDG